MAENNYALDPQLKALSEAARTIAAELSLEQVLQKTARAARDLIGAKYAALGVHNGRGTLSRFVTAGLAPSDHLAMEALPTGQGLLGIFLREGKPLIINDVKNHPAAAGFPRHHPPMRSLLGVPIYSKSKLVGALYLADKQDNSDFTHTDQQLLEMLAFHAAVALENARLYEKTQRLAVLEERERFARDLHDGIIQSIYAVGLSLDSAKTHIQPANRPALEQIELSMNSLAHVINDIRNYIFDLRPHALKDRGLYARLQGLVQELKVNTTLAIEVEIDPNIDEYFNEQQASHLFHIAHEALSNVVRHAKARQVYLGLTPSGQMVTLRVEDDGIGFEALPAPINHGHHGLANVQKRTEALNARLKLESSPRQGTRLTVVIPALMPAPASEQAQIPQPA